MGFKIIKDGEYKLLKSISERVDNYIAEIRILNKKVEENNDTQVSILKQLEDLTKELNEKEVQRKKLASKIGGLKTSLKKQKDKNEQLMYINREIANEYEKLVLKTQKKKKNEKNI